ncbi:DUF5723 family protein [Maribacter algicola]|uniref:DUF5723 family protein n=1 Tax=Meishania litoralis TaxID=3434685 RepID=A0ACC7LJZ2_9FLAO
MKSTRLIYCAFLLAGLFVHAQNKQVLYDFTEIPQSLMVNPGARTDFKWYGGFPALSGVSFQAGSSGISVNDIFADDGLDINDKFRDRIIHGMDARDELSGTYQLELLNVGFRGKNPDNFYSFGIYNEGDAIGYWFQDYAFLGFEGNAGMLNRKYDLGHLKTRGEIVNVFHFGVNRRINGKMTGGIRAKIYSGIVNFHSTRNKGYFVTTEGQNNLLASTLVADMRMRTSGMNAVWDAEKEGDLVGTFLKRGFFGGDLGLGLDLGFSYDLNEQTVFTASLLDLGFIYHANDIRTYALKGEAAVEGIEILPQDLLDPNNDFWQELVDEVEELIPFEIDERSYLTFRPTKLYASLRYNFGEPIQSQADCDCGITPASRNRNRAKYVNGIGGQLYAINRPRGPQMALSAFYQRRFGNFMALKTTYTVDKFSKTNIGLGLNLQAGPVNLYVLADNLLAYRNLAASRYASFQLGINIISWGGKN